VVCTRCGTSTVRPRDNPRRPTSPDAFNHSSCMPRLQSSDFHSYCHTVDTFPPTDEFLLSSRRAPNPTGEDTRITQDKPADVKSPRHPSVHVKVQGKIRRCRIPSYFTLAFYQQTSLHLRHSCARCRTLCNHSVKFSSVSDTTLLAIAAARTHSPSPFPSSPSTQLACSVPMYKHPSLASTKAGN